MSDLRGIIVTHAAVAQALVAAVGAITGVQDALTGVSNEGCGTAELGERLRTAIGEGPAVLFVDLPGGSCFTSSVRYARQHAEIAVVTGVNLDRKSTRLNSSHSQISYAVFCLKKK